MINGYHFEEQLQYLTGAAARKNKHEIAGKYLACVYILDTTWVRCDVCRTLVLYGKLSAKIVQKCSLQSVKLSHYPPHVKINDGQGYLYINNKINCCTLVSLKLENS